MSKSHHYIPQYYLRGFSTPENPKQVWAFERGTKRSFCASTTNIAHENYFYAFPDECSSADKDSIEQFLANEVESPANPVIDKLKSYQLINIEEKQQLAKYITFMFSRVPRYRERVRSTLPQVMEEELSLLETRLELAKEQQLISDELADDVFQAVRNVFKSARDEPPKFFLLPQLHQVIFDVLVNMKWTFLTRRRPPYFLTSDNPFVFTERRGLGNEKAEIIFPVSKNIMLWATWKKGRDCRFRTIGENVVLFANRFIAGNATRFAYYCKDTKWVYDML